MIKLGIINVEEFLRTVNACEGAVYMIQPDGRRTDIGRQYGIQNDLRRQHCNNKGYLKLMLDIPVRETVSRASVFPFIFLLFHVVGKMRNWPVCHETD